jgi:hypothetical protein
VRLPRRRSELQGNFCIASQGDSSGRCVAAESTLDDVVLTHGFVLDEDGHPSRMGEDNRRRDE